MQAAQLIHAAGRSSPGGLAEGTYAIALTTENETELCKLAAVLKLSGIRSELIVESDTPFEGQAMALGIAPTDRKLLKPYLARFPLLK